VAEFIEVATLSELPDPSSQLVEVGDALVVLIHAAGHFYALDDVCTHDGGPLSEGPIDAAGLTIACPRHGAKFRLTDGAAQTMPATKSTRSHEVRIEGETILVRLSDE
jgi:3-phenylpropionate/trans-cinnamate dioxygenase ferredoxin component